MHFYFNSLFFIILLISFFHVLYFGVWVVSGIYLHHYKSLTNTHEKVELNSSIFPLFLHIHNVI